MKTKARISYLSGHGHRLYIDLLIATRSWRKLHAWTAQLPALVERLSPKLPIESDCKCTIQLTSDVEQRRLNYQFRRFDKTTNVLSFPAHQYNNTADKKALCYLGDLSLAYGIIAREALKQGKTVEDHLVHLIVHGLLHLLGYDHENGSEAERMEALEVMILESLNIQNPYD